MSDSMNIMGEVSLDTTKAEEAFGRVEQGAGRMAQAVAKAGNKAAEGVKGMGAGAPEASQKVDGATRSIIGSIQRTTAVMEAGGRTSSKYYEALAAQRGVSVDALKPYLAQLDAVQAKQVAATGALNAGATGLNNVGMSAKATSAALRGVPAQFTDIVTSLQGGQNALTVFLQQGGQLKDMFGGIGPAARALGGYVTGLINPLTLAAGAVGALSLAYSQGSKETDAYVRALALSGNVAGVTAGQMQVMAQRIDGVSGTQAKAAAALALLAEGGSVAGANLERFAQVAVRFESVVGPAVADTAKQFVELGRAPLEASVKLSEASNYLTESVYRQIRALQDQGKASEAASVAQNAYATALESQTAQVERNLGTIERGWRAVKSAIAEAVDAAMNIGRMAGPDAQLASARSVLATLEAQAASRRGRGLVSGDLSASIEAAKARVELLREEVKLGERSAQTRAMDVERNRAGVEFSRIEYDNRSKQQKTEAEIARIRELGLKAGKSELEIEKQVTAVREKYKEAAKRSKEGDPFAAERSFAKEYENAYRDFAKIQADAEAKTDSLSKAQARLIDYLQSPAYAAHSDAMREIVLQQAYAAIGAEQQAAATKELTRAREDEWRAIEKGLEVVYKETESIDEQLRRQIEQNAAIGLSKEALAELEAAKLDVAAATKIKIAAEYEERDGDLALAAVYRQQAQDLQDLAGAKRLGAVKEASADAAKEWRQASESINNSLTDALLRGFESGKGFAQNFRDTLKNMFSTLVLRPVIQGVMSPVSGFISSVGNAAGQYLTGGNGVGGMFSNASTAYSLYNGGAANYASQLGSWFGAGPAASGTYAGVGGTAAGADMSLFYSGSQLGSGGSVAGGAGAGMGTMLAGAGALAVIGAAAYLSVKEWMGEERSGVTFGYDSKSKRTNLITQSNGGRPDGSDQIVSDMITGHVINLNNAFKSFGSALKVLDFKGAWESSKADRGGVFAGGTLSNGVTFGESGAGSNYGSNGPMDSKYEWWGKGGKASYGWIPTPGGGAEGYMGNAPGMDFNGNPKELAVDMQQAFIAAIQASVGILPTITETRSKSTQITGVTDAGEVTSEVTSFEWVRTFDKDMKDRARELGLLPKRILDLIVDVDPEALSDKATKKLTEKITTLVNNVNGFRAIVEMMPFDKLKKLSFDAAAGLVEVAGGLDKLGANLGTYYQNFYSAEEQRNQQARAIGKTLRGAGVDMSTKDVLGTSRDEFRKLVEKFEGDTTRSGQKIYTTLLSVAGAFAAITPPAEAMVSAADKAAAALQRTGAALQASRDTLMQSYERAQEKAARAAEAVVTARDALLGAFQGLANAAAAQAEVINTAKGTVLGAYQSLVDAAARQAQAVATARDALFGAYDSLVSAAAERAQAVAAARDVVLGAYQRVVDAAAAQAQAVNSARDALMGSYQGLIDAAAAQAQAVATARGVLDQAYQNVLDSAQSKAATVDTAKSALLQAYNTESKALEGVVNRHRDYAEQLRSVRDGLTLGADGGLSRAERARQASSLFSTTLAKANKGDESALQSLGNAGTDLVDAVRASARAPAEIAAAIARVQAGLTTAAASSDGRATAAEKQQATLDQQLTALGVLDKSVLTVKDAIKDYAKAVKENSDAQAQLSALERQLTAIGYLDKSVVSIKDAIAGYLKEVAKSTTADAQVKAAKDQLKALGLLSESNLSLKDALKAYSKALEKSTAADEQVKVAREQLTALGLLNESTVSLKDALRAYAKAVDKSTTAEERVQTARDQLKALGLLNETTASFSGALKAYLKEVGKSTEADARAKEARNQLKALGLINDSTISLEKAVKIYLKEVAKGADLDRQVKVAKDQLKALGLIDESVLSVEKALKAYTKAVDRSEFRKEQLDAYTKQLEGLGLLNNSVTSMSKSLSGYLKAVAENTAAMVNAGKAGVPGFASGGYASGAAIVGEQGMEAADFATPARVYTAEQTRGMFAANAELVPLLQRVSASIDGLRTESRAGAVASVTSLQKMESTLKKWEIIGQPPVREEVTS